MHTVREEYITWININTRTQSTRQANTSMEPPSTVATTATTATTAVETPNHVEATKQSEPVASAGAEVIQSSSPSSTTAAATTTTKMATAVPPKVNMGGETPERVYELLQVVWRYQRAVASANEYAKHWQNTAIDWYKVSRYLARVRLEKLVTMLGGATMMHTKNDNTVWSPSHCRRVWKAVVYTTDSKDSSSASSSSTSSSSTSTSSTAPASSTSVEDDPDSDTESMIATIAAPAQFQEEKWASCIAERERSILEESFVLSGGALYRRKCQATHHLKRTRGEIEQRRPRSPLFITAHIPSRASQGLGLRIEEIDMGSRQAVVMGEPHPWSENNIHIMSEFERGERAKICPGQELLAINGGQLVPATLERAVELVASAESPVQLTLRFPPEDGGHFGSSKRRRK